MFNLNNFVMQTVKEMKGFYPDFQIKEYALNWYAKGVLTEADLADLDAFLNPPVPEAIPDDFPDMMPEEVMPDEQEM